MAVPADFGPMSAEEPEDRSTAFAAASVPDNYQRLLAPVIFEPWARVLVDAVGVKSSDRVLDVASGTGVVARLAARYTGPRGRVVASDASGPMLSHSARQPLPVQSAPIEFIEALATELPLPTESFDVVLCQQGLQFFSDRVDAVREMLRVLRVGGVVGAAVWAADYRSEPFDDYAEALDDAGLEPPFPRAFDRASFKMSAQDVRALFKEAGVSAPEVSVVEQTIVWPDSETACAGILGTPFGPMLEALSPADREAVEADLARRFAPDADGAPIKRIAAAVIVRAVKPATR